jgi:hypothetical protein
MQDYLRWEKLPSIFCFHRQKLNSYPAISSPEVSTFMFFKFFSVIHEPSVCGIVQLLGASNR